MITLDIWKMIRKARRDGNSIKGIARTLGISRNTVRKYLRQDDPPIFSKSKPRTSQWQKYKEEIQKQSKTLKASEIYKNFHNRVGNRSSFYAYYKKLKKEKLI